MLHISGYTDANGLSIANATVSLSALVPACSGSEFQILLDAQNKLFNVTLDGIGSSELQIFARGLGAINASNSWNACMGDLLSTLFSPIDETTFIESTTCVSLPGSPEYATDPCCNFTLAWQAQCCATHPQAISAKPAMVNHASISAQCRTADCSAEILTNAAQASFNAHYVCSEALAAALLDPRFLENPFQVCTGSSYAEAGLSVQPCSNASLCASNECEADPVRLVFTDQLGKHVPLMQPLCGSGDEPGGWHVLRCLVKNMHPQIRLVVASRVQINNTALAFDDEYLFDALKNSLSMDVECNSRYGCQQCNFRSMTSDCVVAPWQGDYFCGIGSGCESGGECIEVSQDPACLTLYAGDEDQSSVSCGDAGGTFLGNFTAGFFKANCYLPNSTSMGECFPSLWCPASRVTSFSRQSTCDAYCTFDFITSQQNCSCASLSPSAVCSSFGIAWNSVSLSCDLSISSNLSSFASACEQLGGRYWNGATWLEGFLSDEASCNSVGLCSSDAQGFADAATGDLSASFRVYTHSECSALIGCDVAAANEAECAQVGVCDTAFTYGHCVIAPYLDQVSGAPQCTAYAEPGPSLPGVSCVSSIAELDCDAARGEWQPYPTTDGDWPTRSECPHIPLCASMQTVLSPKPSNTCVSCGGKTVPSHRWLPATWGNGTLFPFKWVPRLDQGPSLTAFNVFGFLSEYSAAYFGLAATFMRRAYVCERAALSSAMSLISCDCGVGATAGCYNRSSVLEQNELVAASTQYCLGVQSSFAPSPFEAAPSFTFTGSGALPTTTMTNPCIGLFFAVTPVATFRKNTDTPFSSFFLAATNLDEFAVIQNRRGVPSGQVRGDGITLFGDNIDGESLFGATLCIREQIEVVSTAPTGLVVPSFATWNASTPGGYTYDLLNLTVYQTTSDTGLYMCINVSASGSYIPVYHATNIESRKWSSALSSVQRIAFTLAAAFYLFFFIVCVWRLMNAVADREARNNNVLLCTLSLLALFSFLRSLMLILLRTGEIAPLSSGKLFAFAELPTMIEFSVATLVIFAWARLYYQQRASSSSSGWKNSLPLLFLITCNVLFCVIFVASVLAVSLTPAIETPKYALACARPRGTPPLVIVDRFYKITIGLCALFLAIATVCYGSVHLIGMRRFLCQPIGMQLLFVMVVTVVGLVLQGVLVIYLAFHQSKALVLIIGIVAELLRPTALLFSARSVGILREWCYCCLGVITTDERRDRQYFDLADADPQSDF